MLRAVLAGDQAFEGAFYSSGGIDLEPQPVQLPTPPIWVATWGSPAGLRRVARTGDGWLASAYNTTPERFGEGLTRLAEALVKEGREPVPNAIATAWMYVTEDPRRAERMLADVLAPLLNRPVDELRSLSLPIGPAEVCAERLTAFRRRGRPAVVRLAAARRGEATRAVLRTSDTDGSLKLPAPWPWRSERDRRSACVEYLVDRPMCDVGDGHQVGVADRPIFIDRDAEITRALFQAQAIAHESQHLVGL